MGEPALMPEPSDPYGELRKLADLHREGVLSDDEFASQKERLLAVVPAPADAAGEELVLSKMANRKQGWRAVGGKLSITNRRIAFGPHAFERGLLGVSWEVDLVDVSEVGKSGVNVGDLFAGGLRPRLQLQLSDGSTELFVINGLDAVVEAVERAKRGA